MASERRSAPSRRPATGPRLIGAAALVLGAIAVRELARPRAQERARVIDWDVVRRRALRGTGESGGEALPAPAAELAARYDAMAAELRPWIEEALEEPLTPERFPAFSAVDRRGWVEVNLKLFQTLTEPVLKLQELLPASALTDLGRRGVSEYLGFMLGFLSQRVLGQYDPVLMAPALVSDGQAAIGPLLPPQTSLYLVEPNIERWEEKAEIGGEPLRQWLVLHEVTHAWEFEAHPWLRDHVNGLIGEMVARRVLAAAVDRETAGSRERLRALLAATVGGRSQWQAMTRVQAVMSLLEGFSNVVMRRVGQAHLPDYEAIDSEFHRRSEQKGVVERLFFKVTGLEMKMRQYSEGERFCDAVIAAGGMEALRRVWSGPEALPTLTEIRNPARWLARTGQGVTEKSRP